MPAREIGVCIFTMNRYSKNFIAQLDSRMVDHSLICDDKDEFICIAIIIGSDGRYLHIYIYIYISHHIYTFQSPCLALLIIIRIFIFMVLGFDGLC